MIQAIRNNFVVAILVVLSVFAFTAAISPVMSSPVLAQADAACAGVELAGGDCSAANGESGVKKVITTIIDVLSIAVGAIAVIMIIIGGLRYVTSSGDSAGVTSARNTIIYAIVGLVIVIFAQTIVAFVIGRVDETPAASNETSEQSEEETFESVEPVN